MKELLVRGEDGHRKSVFKLYCGINNKKNRMNFPFRVKRLSLNQVMMHCKAIAKRRKKKLEYVMGSKCMKEKMLKE